MTSATTPLSSDHPASRRTSRWHATRELLGKVWRLALPYFNSEQKWHARLMFAGIVALTLASVGMSVLANQWYGVFYNALENKDAPGFWRSMGWFVPLALFTILIGVYKFWLTQLLQLRWRTWLTQRYSERWLSGNALYGIELARNASANASAAAPGSSPDDISAPPDNPDQRISEDVSLFTSYTLNLTMGLLDAAVTLVSFVGILWALSGPLSFSVGGAEFTIHGYMVWVAVVYALLGSWLTHLIGRPQVRLNFVKQRFEADFRHHLMRLREYADAIALDRGQAAEKPAVAQRFTSVISSTYNLMVAQKRLIWFSTGYSQIAIIFPFLVGAPRYFAGNITLGNLMQISSAFGNVQGALSWLVSNYSSIAEWKATTDRLLSFEDAVVLAERWDTADATERPVVVPAGTGDGLGLRRLTLRLPSASNEPGRTVVQDASLSFAPGDAVLVQGPSGCGKSTLFRAAAGIWPYGHGEVRMPSDAMFLPQRPYLPNGSLREALAYPNPPNTYGDEALRTALRGAHLPHLSNALDEQATWSQRLSPGEQQRLAIARALLRQPRWLFADEATSALDEATEAPLYDQLREMTAGRGGGLVSIAHKPSIHRFHNQVIQFEAPSDSQATGQLSTRPIGPSTSG
jgi:putative ATP-binding cassette transporter